MTNDHEGMTWRESAVREVMALRRSHLPDRPTERVGIDRVSGRVLAEDVVAEEDVPAHDVATMDGYAIDASDDYPLELVESTVHPEDRPASIDDGQAIETATGARLPPGADAVLKYEDARIEKGLLYGPSLDPGTYTYRRGSNVSEGERLFVAGDRLQAKDAILLADLGYDEVEVYEPFSVGVLATGTEIHEGTTPDLDTPMLLGLIESWGGEPTVEGTVPDEYDRTAGTIEDLAARYDVVVTTGGTSVGKKDYVVRALADLGEVIFHRVRIRPGKPVAVATVDGAIAFAIPGKPLGAYTASTLVMRPFFAGETTLPTIGVRLASAVDLGPGGFEYVVPVTVEDGTATPMGHLDSPLPVYEETFDPSVISSSTRATRADAFVVAREPLSAGESVRAVPYAAVE